MLSDATIARLSRGFALVLFCVSLAVGYVAVTGDGVALADAAVLLVVAGVVLLGTLLDAMDGTRFRLVFALVITGWGIYTFRVRSGGTLALLVAISGLVMAGQGVSKLVWRDGTGPW